TYGTTYSGPIGAVITPHLRGLQDWKHLSAASSLCGACTETCQVKIDLHHHLIQNRRNAANQKPSFGEKFAFKVFAFAVNRPVLWNFGKKCARIFQPLQNLIKGTAIDPAKAWTKTRDLPPLAKESFKDWWKKRE
ncbi:MAG: lactate utilization protein LutB domain-containing protein, partial [Limisphaerales bacterium]